MSSTRICDPGQDRIGRKGGVPKHQAKALWDYVCQGMTRSQAYRKVFPRRKVTDATASTMGGLIYSEYERKYAHEIKEIAERNNVTVDRYFRKIAEKFEAEVFDEKVESYIGEDGKAVTLRNSVVVPDHRIQLDAAKEAGRSLGIGPQPGESGGIQQNVFVYVEGQVHKTRQKRYVGGNGHGEGKRRGAD